MEVFDSPDEKILSVCNVTKLTKNKARTFATRQSLQTEADYLMKTETYPTRLTK